MNHEGEVGKLRKRIEILEHVCAEAYQFAGALGAPECVLDNLSAAAEGRDLPHESFLPVTADDCDEVAQLRTALARVREVVGSVGA